MKVLGNPWFATVVTLLPGLALTFGGYLNIWPLFGASNQLLGGMTMITLAVFCKCTGRKGLMLYVPVAFLLVCTFTSLGMEHRRLRDGAADGWHGRYGHLWPAARVRRALGCARLIVTGNCLNGLRGKEFGSMPDEEPEWSEMGARDYRARQVLRQGGGSRGRGR